MKKINKRDKFGWRIPRPGTLSRSIYDRMIAGATPKEVAKALGTDSAKVRVLAHRFRNPDWASERR